MRRDELEVGKKYLGPYKRCYEILDLEPGWRIGFDQDWLKDSSTRQRTLSGNKKVPFRKNNALRAFIWENDQPTKAVITPNRLLMSWEKHMEHQQRLEDQEGLVREVLMEFARVVAANGHRPGSYEISADCRSVVIPVTDLKAALLLD